MGRGGNGDDRLALAMAGSASRETKPPADIVTNAAIQKIKCWHCGGNHRLANKDQADFSDGLKVTINL